MNTDTRLLSYSRTLEPKSCGFWTPEFPQSSPSLAVRIDPIPAERQVPPIVPDIAQEIWTIFPLNCKKISEEVLLINAATDRFGWRACFLDFSGGLTRAMMLSQIICTALWALATKTSTNSKGASGDIRDGCLHTSLRWYLVKAQHLPKELDSSNRWLIPRPPPTVLEIDAPEHGGIVTLSDRRSGTMIHLKTSMTWGYPRQVIPTQHIRFEYHRWATCNRENVTDLICYKWIIIVYVKNRTVSWSSTAAWLVSAPNTLLTIPNRPPCSGVGFSADKVSSSETIPSEVVASPNRTNRSSPFSSMPSSVSVIPAKMSITKSCFLEEASSRSFNDVINWRHKQPFSGITTAWSAGWNWGTAVRMKSIQCCKIGLLVGIAMPSTSVCTSNECAV